MRTIHRNRLGRWIVTAIFGTSALLLPLGTPAEDFTYTTNSGAITITGYAGPGGSLSIPRTINGLPVTTIGGLAFNNCNSLTRVTIPDSVTTIQPGLAPAGGAFGFCTSITNVTVGKGLTSIGNYAFVFCRNLTGIYFRGDAPGRGSQVFDYSPVTVYYLPGTIGWEPTFGGASTKLWNPKAETTDGGFGVRINQFAFNITGTADIPIVVEACTNMAAPIWFPLQSGTLTNGLLHFSDPSWTNYLARFYRIRSP